MPVSLSVSMGTAEEEEEEVSDPTPIIVGMSVCHVVMCVRVHGWHSDLIHALEKGLHTLGVSSPA